MHTTPSRWTTVGYAAQRLTTKALAAVLLTAALSPMALAAKTTKEAPAKEQPAATQAAPEAKPEAAATPAAEPAAPAAAPAAKKEVVDNPYGMEALWAQGDFVAKGTLVILIIMSMGSWYVLITKLIEQAKLFRHAGAVGGDFWKASSVQSAVGQLDESSPFRFVADQGLQASASHKGSLVAQMPLADWTGKALLRGTQAVNSRLQGGLAVLATVGSTAPFVGLFGTVWGIYHALTAIGIAGQASIDKVAGPVGEALIMTAIGLAVAVPAVLGYNWLVRRNKAVMEEVNAFGSDLHAVLLGQARQ